ncbi:MAG: bifunctional RNase H/acid phosphatase [Nocardioides sp.]
MAPPDEGSHRAVCIEADGGSRGNPGAAAYGAVLMDAATGEMIAQRAECIGTATNNVAEYRGLIAGLELYNEHAPEAELEVRMDSKLVVEQMSGRWKIKHPDMKPLAMAAHRLAPFGTTYTWIPRERNRQADLILNEALDAAAGKSPRIPKRAKDEQARPVVGWGPDPGAPTTLILVRHGETEHTREKRFSGTGGLDPGLNPDGQAQVRATAEWLAPLAEEIDVLVSSPLRRTRETAEIVAELLGHRVELDDGLAEAAFGTWDGLTFTEVQDRHRDDLDAWLGGLDASPSGGGESFRAVDRRVRRTRDRLIAAHPGRTVLAVTHVTPIKVLVRLALEAPLESLFHMELAPASVSVVSWFPDGRASMRMFNARPMESAFLAR